MTDFIDQAADHAQKELDAILKRQRALTPPPNTDQPECQQCGEPIGAPRMALGARLCLQCQREAETRARQQRGAR